MRADAFPRSNDRPPRSMSPRCLTPPVSTTRGTHTGGFSAVPQVADTSLKGNSNDPTY